MRHKVNTTGSLTIDDEGNFWSYNTKLTTRYKGVKIYNGAYFSRTTRKHQAYIRSCYYYDIELQETNMSLENIEIALQDELKYIKNEIDVRLNKRKTKANMEAIEALEHGHNYLVELLYRKEVA